MSGDKLIEAFKTAENKYKDLVQARIQYRAAAIDWIEQACLGLMQA